MELSFTRIGLLMKKQLIENRKLYLLGILAMMGIMSFVFIFFAQNHGLSKSNQGAFFHVGLTSFGCLFTLTLFKQYELKEQRTQALTLPTSQLEKLLCAIFFGIIIYPLTYLITVYPLLLVVNYIDNNYLGNNNLTYHFNLKTDQIIFIHIYLVLQTLVLMLSVCFKQYKIVKSILILCLLFFGSIFIFPKMVKSLLPEGAKGEITVKQHYLYNDKVKTIKVKELFRGPFASIPYSSVQYFSDKRNVNLELPKYQKTVFYSLLCLCIPFMWLITWLKLKELEIN